MKHTSTKRWLSIRGLAFSSNRSDRAPMRSCAPVDEREIAPPPVTAPTATRSLLSATANHRPPRPQKPKENNRSADADDVAHFEAGILETALTMVCKSSLCGLARFTFDKSVCWEALWFPTNQLFDTTGAHTASGSLEEKATWVAVRSSDRSRWRRSDRSGRYILPRNYDHHTTPDGSPSRSRRRASTRRSSATRR